MRADGMRTFKPGDIIIGLPSASKFYTFTGEGAVLEVLSTRPLAAKKSDVLLYARYLGNLLGQDVTEKIGHPFPVLSRYFRKASAHEACFIQRCWGD